MEYHDVNELSLNTPWSITEESFQYIVQLFHHVKPSRVLEFGSGVSSVRLALELPGTQIHSVDHNESFAISTRNLGERWLNRNNLTVSHQPLGYRWYGLSPILSYSTFSIPYERKFDCVLIDGPPSHLSPRGREACLYLAYNHIPINGYIILDDYERQSEKAVVQNWLATYPGSFVLETIDAGHGLAILRKVQSVTPRRLVPSRVIDIVTVMSRTRVIHTRAFISRVISFISRKLFNPLGSSPRGPNQ